jgi:hypothetical protein
MTNLVEAQDATPLLERYLTPSGMAAAHTALTERFSWFLHVSDTSLFETIKSQGLKPHNPGCAPHDLAVKHLGDMADKILCLRPLSTFDTTPERGKPRFILAVAKQHLPILIGLDWSYGGAWNLAGIIKDDAPELPDEQVFCEVVRRWGSVAAYDGVPASSLRVRCKGMTENDPGAWSTLTSVERDELHVF